MTREWPPRAVDFRKNWTDLRDHEILLDGQGLDALIAAYSVDDGAVIVYCTDGHTGHPGRKHIDPDDDTRPCMITLHGHVEVRPKNRRLVTNERRRTLVTNPTPREGESTDDFIGRCMGSEEAMEDFPDQDQRLAFCFSEARRAGRDVPEPSNSNNSEGGDDGGSGDDDDGAARNTGRTNVTLAVRREGPMRTERLWQRDFTVFPATLVREQVLDNNLGRSFLPVDEIERSVEAWNMMPVVIRHPVRNGEPISAREVEVLNATGVGFLFRARMKGTSLVADVLLDPELVESVDGASDVVTNVSEEGAAELSTGFGARIENVGGQFDGRDFDLIMRDLTPDHLALLPDEVGACSVGDGCGLGVNERRANPERVRGWLLRRYRDTLDAFNRWVGRTDARQQSDEDRRMQIQEALQDSFGGANTRIFIDSMFSDDNTVVFERFNESNGEFDLMRVSFSMDGNNVSFTGDPEPVRRVTSFEPVANADGTSAPQPTGEDIMNRSEMIRRLVANGTLDEAALTRLSDAQLQALCNCGSGQGQGQGGGDPAPQPAATTATNVHDLPAPPPDASERERLAYERMMNYRRENEELRRRFEPTESRMEEERVQLIDDLLYARNRAYDDDEIRAMNLDQLRKLHKTIYGDRAPSFAGRGLPGATTEGGAGSFGFVKPILVGQRGESVLDESRAAAGGRDRGAA